MDVKLLPAENGLIACSWYCKMDTTTMNNVSTKFLRAIRQNVRYPLLVIIELVLLAAQGAAAEAALVAHWPMDEGKGVMALDQSGNANHGKLIGTATWVDGREGKAIELDGTGYIDCGTRDLLNLKNKITIEAWVKPYSPSPGAVVSRYDRRGGFLLVSSWGDNFRPSFFIRQSPKEFTVIQHDSLALNTWHHLVATAEMGGQMRLYANGTLLACRCLQHAFGGAPAEAMPPLLIGKYADCYFRGAIDDVKIYNGILDEKLIARKKVVDISAEALAAPHQAIDKLRVQASSRQSASPGAERWKKHILQRLDEEERRLARIAIGAGIAADRDQIEAIGSKVAHLSNLAGGLEQGKITSSDWVCFVQRPISSQKVLPDGSAIAGEISETVRFIACPGETEPASFAIYARTDLHRLRVEASDLTGDGGTIPARQIDIKGVKCWYQGGTAWKAWQGYDKRRILVPELLLNDDSLVKVDHENKDNYLKLKRGDAETYLKISVPSDSVENKKELRVLSIKDYPVSDSPVFLPLDIPANATKQFWLTIKVPDNAKPGWYSGKLKIAAGENLEQRLDVVLRILPFKLAPYPLTSSIFYRGKLDQDYPEGSISSEYKSEKQMRAEFADLLAHGVTNPTVMQSFENRELLGRMLQLRAEAGLDNRCLYYVGGLTGNASSADGLRVLKEKVQTVRAFFKRYGVEDVYFYGMDEARGEKLRSQREAWMAVHEAGGKVFVAGAKDMNFPIMGDLQDLFICAYYPSKREAADWHSVGHKIWCYANPQGGVENPEIYRRNYGLLLWKYDYDGACLYAYQAAMRNIWNDFDWPLYRDEVFAYPTIEGIIDTIAWEGYREGIDDMRYLRVLQQEIETSTKLQDAEGRQLAAAANDFLGGLDVENRSLDTIRLEIIDYILRLQAQRNRRNCP
ncbi:MAG: LamG domain-containing protein [Verrucomicrobiae bacterium]|nr:LamG domain-containing protein [Verrucomicrobiae bacterium]